MSLDASELATLRTAAALAHVVAGVRLRVRHGPTPLLEVGPPPFDAEGRWIIVVTTAPAGLVAKTAGSVADAFDDTTADARVVTRRVAACDADDAVDQCQQLLSQLGVLELEAWLAEVS